MRWPAEHLAGALEGAADDLRQIDHAGAGDDGAGFDACHVQQIADEAVQPLGLFLDGADHLALARLVQILGLGLQAGGGAQNGSKRRAQIVGDGGEHGRAQPVGFRRQPGAVDILGKRDALDGERRLVEQGIQQPALVGPRRQPGRSPARPTTPTTPRPVRIGRNSQASSVNLSAPRPAGRLSAPAAGCRRHFRRR